MKKNNEIRIIPIGGVNEVGKNMTLIEKDNEILIIDCGIMFPDSEMPGIDYIIPDFEYIKKNMDRVRAIVLTHGHEDHIGALPYLFKELRVPVYGTKLTLGLVRVKLQDVPGLSSIKLNEINPDKPLNLGSFNIEFFRVNHIILHDLDFFMFVYCHPVKG